MPNFNGMGPFGMAPMTGRGLGPRGGAQVFGRGRRKKGGFGMGKGAGAGIGRCTVRATGRGFGSWMSWFPAGYGADDLQIREQGLKATLEQRAAFLRAELERTESMLNDQTAETED